MPKTRDLLYLSYTEKDKMVLSYGMEFNEFINCVPLRPKHILVLEGNYFGSEFDFTTRCEICHEQDLDEFIQEEVYNYGDFCWMDFDNMDGLKALCPSEVAELLYLGKLKEPVSSPFFEKLGNRYAYLAHDDGWWNRIYYREVVDFKRVLNKMICLKIEKIHNRMVNPLNDAAVDELVELSKNGLAIDFDTIIEAFEDDGFEVKMHCLGAMVDMDLMYDNYERLKAKAGQHKCLVYANESWSVQTW